jgi:hypothetical protein
MATELILAKDLPAPSQLVARLLQIKVLKDELDLLEEQTRAELKADTNAKKIQTSAGEVSIVESQRLTFNNDLVLAIITAKGIAPELIGSFEFKADEKKIQAAISAGLITNEELQGSVKISTYDRFTIKPTTEVKDVLSIKAKSSLLLLADGSLK